MCSGPAPARSARLRRKGCYVATGSNWVSRGTFWPVIGITVTAIGSVMGFVVAQNTTIAEHDTKIKKNEEELRLRGPAIRKVDVIEARQQEMREDLKELKDGQKEILRRLPR